MRYSPFVAAFLVGTLTAQGPFVARHFLPNDYHNIVRVDLAQLRETGIWDELEVGMLKMFFGMMEKEAGFELESLDRLTIVPMANPARTADGGMAPRQLQVLIFEGNAELDVPDRVGRNDSYAPETIGNQEVMRRSQWGDEVFFRPRPEVQIYGSTELVRPVLEGKPSAGIPCADIMSLMSGREKSLLYFVIHLADGQLNDQALKLMFSGVEWPEGGEPQYMLLRLAAVGDPDDPHIEFESVLRHAKAGEGLDITDKAIDSLLERAAEQPQLRLVMPLLEKLERARDRTDLSLKLDLGRARTAAGHLAMILVPMMTLGATVEQAQAIEVVELEEAAEPPPPPPPAKDPGKNKKKL